MEDTVRHSPHTYGHSRSRWTLRLLHKTCPLFERFGCLSGVWRALRRLRLRWKRGRVSVTSPDPAYDQKLVLLTRAFAAARSGSVVLLYADEVSCYRQPVVGTCWSSQGGGGKKQWTVPRSHRANTRYRMVGALDAVTGRTLYRTGSKVGVKALCAFLRQVRAGYGPDVRLLLAWDNWPVHYHDDVLACAAQEQIELLWLPTYAPWTNPIEKLWRWLKEEVFSMHRKSEQWEPLKAQACAFLEQFAKGSDNLLRYVGLAH